MHILFDIGGTKMRLAATVDNKRFGTPKIILTPRDFESGIESFKKIATDLAKGKKIKSVVGGVAGSLDRQKSKLVSAPNLPAWVNKSLKKKLAQALGVPTYIANDTAMAGLGECIYGAGRGYRIVVYLTISTGVGGVRIVNGQIDENYLGFEPGHQIINFTGLKCPTCNSSGHLENYISGAALARKYNKQPVDITNKKIWDRIAYLLAVGLHNSIVHWSPEAVVLGGSMMKRIPLTPVRKYLKKSLTMFSEVPVIKKATLGDINGIYGARCYAKLIEQGKV